MGSEGGKDLLGDVTQLHAAAVNGDRSTLARLINAFPMYVDAGEQFGRTPLMFCAMADRVECAELLVKRGVTVDKRDKGGRTALHWAAHKGNSRLMKLLIHKGANIREKDNEGQTCLHLCTRHKSAKCISLLLKQLSPGEIDDQDHNKRTALHWASSYGNFEHVKMLIKQDSNIGIPDSEGKTPLHWAASSRSSEAVRCVYLILKTTPSVINWQDYEGRTALHLSVADGNEEVVDVLTSIDNCMVSALDNMFRTPLHWAAVLGHTEIVSILLKRCTEYDSSDGNGATPLHYAAQNNYEETVETFLCLDSVTDEPDLDGRTAFIWASSKGADDVVRVFVRHAVDIHQVDNNGATALHAAALSGHPSTVKLLLDADALIDASDLTKHTPLLRACEMGHMDVVTTLIEAGARVDVVDQHAHSPLHWAALGGHAYICQILISNGVDPGVRDHSGRMPLQCAAYGGFVNCMSVLLEHSADPNAQDSEGMTAFHWACSRGHLDAVKLLAEYYAFPNHMEFTEDRYTPLDYTLMGEHHDVAQCMIELGALSITAIQDIAAQKIQSTFRGYRVRKTFMGRKQLLMKHEQLKKEAAKKRATVVVGDNNKQDRDVMSVDMTAIAESNIYPDAVNKERPRITNEMCHARVTTSPSERNTVSDHLNDNVTAENTATELGRVAWVSTMAELVSDVYRGAIEDDRDPGLELSQDRDVEDRVVANPCPRDPADVLMSKNVLSGGVQSGDRYRGDPRTRAEFCHIVEQEQMRLRDTRTKQHSVLVVQRAWRRYKERRKGMRMPVTSHEAVKMKRQEHGSTRWTREKAAVTIQLAWRKYYRRRLIEHLCLTCRRTQLQVWRASSVSTLRDCCINDIYGEEIDLPVLHLSLNLRDGHIWLHTYNASASNCSSNLSREPSNQRPASSHTHRSNYALYDKLHHVKLPPDRQPTQFSYNMRE